MAYIMTTEAEIIQKAGAGKSASFDTTMMTASNLRAESVINCITRRNWSDDSAGLNIDVKQILSDFCSSFAAIEAVAYDMSGYTSRIEAEDIINVQRDSMLRNMQILRDKQMETFIDGAT